MKNILLLSLALSGCAIFSPKISMSDFSAESLIVGNWQFEKLLSKKYEVNFTPFCEFTEDRKVDCTYTGSSCGGFCCELGIEIEKGWDSWSVEDGYLVLEKSKNKEDVGIKVRIVDLAPDYMELQMSGAVARYKRFNKSSKGTP